MEGELEAKAIRGAESRRLMILWLPIAYNVFLTIGVSICATLPWSWFIRTVAILVYAAISFYFVFFSVWGKRKIWNLVFKVKRHLDNNEF